MSCSKWAYDPMRCDSDVCPGDCDYCNKTWAFLATENDVEMKPAPGDIRHTGRKEGSI